MSGRDAFVYRAYDERGELLYIGCTNRVTRRHEEHVKGSAWMRYAARFTMAGPYEYHVAYRKESAAIATDEPWFNCQIVDRTAKARRRSAERARWTDLYRSRPDIFDASVLTDDQADEHDRLLDETQFCIDFDHPVYDEDWRHAAYLNATVYATPQTALGAPPAEVG